MVNELTLTVHATVVLHAPDGSTLGQQVVTFSPHSQQVVSIKSILNSEAISDVVGSVQVVPNPMEVQTMAIAAQLSIVNTREFPPAYFEEELLAPDPMQATVYRAVAPASAAAPLITLLNTTTAPEMLTVTCLSNNGNSGTRSYKLAAFQALTVHACRDAALSDGSSVVHGLDSMRDVGSGVPAGIEVSSDSGMGTFAA